MRLIKLFSSDMEIEHIGQSLVNRTLPKPDWTHAAHFAAALWMIDNPAYTAALDMPDIIRRYNEATGVENSDTDGYHETITLASLKAAKSFMAKRKEAPLFETVNQLLASDLGRSNWLLNYWTKETLFSVKARKHWVEPDIKTLPF